MKKVFIVILMLILLRIVYDYIDSQNYFSEFYDEDVVMVGGEPYASEEYQRYISLKKSTEKNHKTIDTNSVLLHIDFSEIKNADTYQVALSISNIERNSGGIVYEGKFQKDILVDMQPNIYIYVQILDHKKQKAYSLFQHREIEWKNEFMENNEAYIKLRKDAKIDIKFNKYLPYFWVPWVYKNDTFSRYILALILSIFD